MLDDPYGFHGGPVRISTFFLACFMCILTDAQSQISPNRGRAASGSNTDFFELSTANHSCIISPISPLALATTLMDQRDTQVFTENVTDRDNKIVAIRIVVQIPRSRFSRTFYVSQSACEEERRSWYVIERASRECIRARETPAEFIENLRFAQREHRVVDRGPANNLEAVDIFVESGLSEVTVTYFRSRGTCVSASMLSAAPPVPDRYR
jgi:hypothetical protein